MWILIQIRFRKIMANYYSKGSFPIHETLCTRHVKNRKQSLIAGSKLIIFARHCGDMPTEMAENFFYAP